MLIKIEDSRVNFIDENDVFVGYDTEQSCCEFAGWFISPNKSEGIDNVSESNTYGSDELVGYTFVTVKPTGIKSYELDCGNQMAFELVRPDSPSLYLHVFNAHNGWYGHDLLMKDGDVTLFNETI